jgi:hypothetical protein
MVRIGGACNDRNGTSWQRREGRRKRRRRKREEMRKY